MLETIDSIMKGLWMAPGVIRDVADAGVGLG